MSNCINPVLLHLKNKVLSKVNRSPFTIGRGAECDYQLLNLTISRIHCKLENTTAGWVLRNLSSNGTLINGVLCPEGTSRVLKSFDYIRLGTESWSLQFIYLTLNRSISHSNSNAIRVKIVTSQRPATADEQSASSSYENLDSNVKRLKRCRALEASVGNKALRIFEAVPQLQMHSSELVDYTVDLTNDLSPNKCMIIEATSDKSAGMASADLATLTATAETAPNPPQEKVHSLFENMETELMCTICSNLFIKAVTLECSHSFCSFCIKRWRKKSSTCPICRTDIKSVTRTLVLDNLIDKVMENASSEDRKERQEAIAVIQNEETKTVTPPRKNRRGRRGRSRPEPVRIGPSFVRCNRCDCLGHLSATCPFPIEDQFVELVPE